MTSRNFSIENIDVGEPFESSDHQIIRFESLTAMKCVKTKITKLNYFKGNYDKIRERFGSIDWDRLDVGNNWLLTDGWVKIRDELLHAKDEFVPLKKEGKSKCKWVTCEVTRCRKAKKEAWQNYIKSGRNSVLYDIYKEKLNKSVSVNRIAVGNYEKRLADNIKTDCKSFFAYANNKSVTSNKIVSLLDRDDKIIQDENIIASMIKD